ncbi:putative 4a-hydroxytetrahydrobiopterin dehydratase [Microsporum ferrugineum]
MMITAARLYPARALFARPTRMSSCLFSNATTPVVSQGVSESRLTDELNQLLQAGWTLDETRCGIEKVYYFKTYTKCQKTGSVHVHWTTHHPRGLSLQDTIMARYCDEQSSSIGTVEQNQSKKCHPAPA